MPQLNCSLRDNQVFSRLQLDPGQFLHGNSVFLDLGCGTRNDVATGAAAYGAQYIGVDIGRGAQICCDAHLLCLNTESVDVAFSAPTLEHFRNPWVVVQEVRRVLKAGGIFVGLVAFLQPEHDYPGSYFHMSAKGVRVLLEENGFVDVNTIGAGGPYGLEYLAQGIVGPIPLLSWFVGKCARSLEIIRFGGEWLNVALLVRRNELDYKTSKSYLQSRLERWDAAIIFYGRKPES
jgi:SAM-dependent methyltransferase